MVQTGGDGLVGQRREPEGVTLIDELLKGCERGERSSTRIRGLRHP